MIPKNRIELYNTSDVLQYTIDNEALSIHVKEILTSGIGTFNFTLSTMKGTTNEGYSYNDVATHWKAKIYLGYDSISASDLVAVGRIQKITGPLSIGGYVRVFEGKNLGEVLERNQKTNTCWVGVEADDIVAELANDLSLGTGQIAVDTTAETLTIRTETYYDVLKKVSDYWYSAVSKVQKDFYVDASNNLVWKARPIRTADVETLTLGENIESYSVLRDILPVKNAITVYGAPYTTYLADRDGWTEPLTDWVVTVGTLSLDGVSKKAGSFSICCTPQVGGTLCHFHHIMSSTNIRDINKLSFWRSYSNINAGTYQIRIRAPDSSNYFTSTSIGSTGGWTWCELALGPSQIYDVNLNPNGIWTVGAGSPNWWDMRGIEFYINNGAVNCPDYIDVLYFSPVRFSDVASDATSQTNYGVREGEFTDDALTSDAQCQSRAESLLMQLKDPPTRIDITTKGNTNLKIGDRLSITIPAEQISAANYDVVSVIHDYTKDPEGFKTIVSMIDSSSNRSLPAGTTYEAIQKQFEHLRSVARGIELVR